MEETKENKKMKMEAMRHMVKAHIFKGHRENVKHLGELDLDKSDNVRLIISLQDLAENILGKKRKAEARIAHLQQVVASYAGAVTEYSGDLVRTRHHVKSLQEQLEARDKHIADLEKQLNKTNSHLAMFKEMFIDNSQNQKSAMPMPVREEAPTRAETPTGRNMSWHQVLQEFPGSKGGL